MDCVCVPFRGWMGKTKNVCAFERGMVVGTRRTGLCQELLYFSPSTVSCVFQAWSTSQRTFSQLDTTVGSNGVNMGQHPVKASCRVHAPNDLRLFWGQMRGCNSILGRCSKFLGILIVYCSKPDFEPRLTGPNVGQSDCSQSQKAWSSAVQIPSVNILRWRHAGDLFWGRPNWVTQELYTCLSDRLINQLDTWVKLWPLGAVSSPALHVIWGHHMTTQSPARPYCAWGSFAERHRQSHLLSVIWRIKCPVFILEGVIIFGPLCTVVVCSFWFALMHEYHRQYMYVTFDWMNIHSPVQMSESPATGMFVVVSTLMKDISQPSKQNCSERCI